MRRSLSIWLLGLLAGCAAHGPAPKPVTQIPVEQSRGAYWYAKATSARAISQDYDRLWQAAIQTAIADEFRIDRTDYRLGVLTTHPLVSKQAFEVWRSDVVDGHGLAQSTLGTVRRTIRFEIARNESGQFVLRPKVLIERHSLAEHRITSVTQYKDVFAYDRPLEQQTTDQGTALNADYWYAIGRDPDFERVLANQIQRKIGAVDTFPPL